MREASCMDVDKKTDKSSSETRTVTSTSSSILHKDLSPPMKKVVLEKFDDYLSRIFDFTSDCDFVIPSLMLSLRGIEFVKTNTGVTIQISQRFKVEDRFLVQFSSSVPNHYTSAPMSTELLGFQLFHQEIKEMFQYLHLGFVNSTFFGSRGAKKENTDRRPIKNLMNMNIQGYSSHLTHSHNELPTHLKYNVSEKYKVIVANMWAGRTQMTKLLN